MAQNNRYSRIGNLNEQKDILHEIAEASEAIRKKHKLIKLDREAVEQTSSDTFKPVVTPI